MKKIILTIGASCSGKSTWAEQFIKDREVREDFYGVVRASNDWVNINRDDIRFKLFTDNKRNWTQYKFNKKNERSVTESADKLANEAALGDFNIIISDTNLNPSIRQKWKDFAETHGYEYEEKVFHCSWEELVKRNAQRGGGIPESILWSQYKRFIQQYGCIGEHKLNMYRHNPMLENTIICDLDGTICDMTGIRKPYEWALVGKDKPRTEIIRALEGLAYVHGHVTFMSGRDGCCWNETYDWIVDNVTSDWPEWIEWSLVMRTPDDNRKDDVVKYELFNQYIRGKFNVAAALDDRPRVVRLWALLGIPNIIQVGEYNNEF